jgi:hypothetical protein
MELIRRHQPNVDMEGCPDLTLRGRNLLTRETYGFRHAQLKVVAHRDRLSPSLDGHGLAIVTDR